MRNKLRKLDFLNYSNDRTLVRETRGEIFWQGSHEFLYHKYDRALACRLGRIGKFPKIMEIGPIGTQRKSGMRVQIFSMMIDFCGTKGKIYLGASPNKFPIIME